jgi:hypothetical protein
VQYHNAPCFARSLIHGGIILPDPIVFPNGEAFPLEWGPDEITLSEITQSPQLTIEQERLEWKEKEERYLNIIDRLSGAPKSASRSTSSQAAPKDGFVTKYPKKSYYESATSNLSESYPQLMKDIMSIMKDPKPDKPYYRMYNMAVAMLIMLKAARTDDMNKAFEEWVKN